MENKKLGRLVEAVEERVTRKSSTLCWGLGGVFGFSSELVIAVSCYSL